MDLKDRVVVVTGAARGLGKGIAQATVELGATTVMTDIDASELEAAAASLGSHTATIATRTMDVTDAGSIDATLASIVDGVGQIDGWVNNAGIVTMAPAFDLTDDAWSRELDVNLAGVFRCCRSVGRAMERAGRPGSIVNVASNAGKVGFADMAAYNASKAAVINLTRSLAREWADHRINVNCVCPGGVETPMLQAVAEQIAREEGSDYAEVWGQMGSTYLGRRIAPIEVGRVVAFLLSDDAQIIRGQAINVDGGDTPY